MNDTTFHQRLVSVMTDNKFDRPVSNQKSGKLDGRKIYKIERSPKIFTKRIERKGKFYNVSLVIDVSGSMSEHVSEYGAKRVERIDVATDALLELAKHFDKIGINYEIMAFNAVMWQLKYFNEKCPPKDDLRKTLKGLVGYSREYRVGINVKENRAYNLYTDEEARKRHQDNPGDWCTRHVASDNNDGEAVFLARRRLEKMKGEKITVVLSDGCPAPSSSSTYSADNPKMKYGDYSLKKEAKKVLDKGIHLISVGIHYGGITNYYPKENCVIIKDMKDLYVGIIEKLSKQIKRN